MQSGGLSAFSEAREEIEFWPAVAGAYYAVQTDSVLSLIAFILLILSGAIMFKMHQALRKQLKGDFNKAGVRNRKSREDKSNFEVIVDGGRKFWAGTHPQNSVSRNIVFLGMLGNLIGGIVLFIWLVQRILIESSPTVSGLGLLALPLLMVAVIISTLLWNS